MRPAINPTEYSSLGLSADEQLALRAEMREAALLMNQLIQGRLESRRQPGNHWGRS